MGSTAPMTYVVDVSGEMGVAGDRDTIGGWPVLDADQPWPVCDCGARMALYFQVEVPAGVPHYRPSSLRRRTAAGQYRLHPGVPGALPSRRRVPGLSELSSEQ
ncbi:hypothetical protein [Nocardia sp. NBC_01388]|uniref:hypothetical protein n=1 Tax=Nocardia sp. NBC_01388 TaxID=2903596 RepID=UPI003252FE89